MIGLKVDAAKGLFFDRARVMAATKAASRRALSRAGFLVRSAARKSIRPARQKKLGELSEEERKRYERRLRRWERDGRKGPRPRRPMAHSKPGEAPRSITGLLRNFLFFVYDPPRESVVIGPALLNSGDGKAPRVLEYGGSTWSRKYRRVVRIRPRPYMRPALEKERPKIAELWRNSIKAG